MTALVRLAVAQARQSVVLIDSAYEAFSFQVKFMTAVVASAFGRCYPFVILLSTELSVLALLCLARRRDYSNVLSVCSWHERPKRAHVYRLSAL